MISQKTIDNLKQEITKIVGDYLSAADRALHEDNECTTKIMAVFTAALASQNHHEQDDSDLQQSDLGRQTTQEKAEGNTRQKKITADTATE